MGNGMPPKNPFAGMSFNKNNGTMDLGKAADAASPNTAGGWIGLGSGLVSGIGSMMPSPYDQRIGMEKPSFLKEMMDMTYTGMGATIGGPWGALVGGIIDTGKNIGSYINKKAKFNTATQRWENDEAQDQRLQSIGQDYTGYARYGTRTPYSYGNGGGVPVEIERNEVIFMPQQDGSYQLLGGTGSDAPTHEQGGVKTSLPQGALVFPKQYIPQVMQAYQSQDWAAMDGISQEMLAGAEQAAMEGQPYSSGGMPMFTNGGEVLAKKVREYDPAVDTDRKMAQTMFQEVLDAHAKGEIDNDERDMIVSGMISRINPEEAYATHLKTKYPDQYNYFQGKADKFAAAEFPDVVGSEDTQMRDIGYLQRKMGFQGSGAKQRAYSQLDVDDEATTAEKKYDLGQYSVDELFNATRMGLSSTDGSYNVAYKSIFDKINKANPKAEIPSKWHTVEGEGDKVKYKPVDPATYNKPQQQQSTTTTPTTTPSTQPQNESPAKTTQPAEVKPSTSGTLDRTSSRHAAIKAGVYQDKDGTPLTYWDDKTGKRMFTAAASKYGMTGDATPFMTGASKPTAPTEQKLQQYDYAKGQPMGGTPAAPKAQQQQVQQPKTEAPVIPTAPVAPQTMQAKDSVSAPVMPKQTMPQAKTTNPANNTGLQQVMQQYAQHLAMKGVSKASGAESGYATYSPEKAMQYAMSLVQKKMGGGFIDADRAVQDAKAGGFYDEAFQEIVDSIVETAPVGSQGLSYRKGGKTPYMKGGKSC